MVKGKVVGIKIDEDEGGVWTEVTIAFRRRGLPNTLCCNWLSVIIDDKVVDRTTWIDDVKADHKARFNEAMPVDLIEAALNNYDQIVKRYHLRISNKKHNDDLNSLSLGYVNMEYITREAYNE